MNVKEPRLAFEPPEPRHCPKCEKCERPETHCESEGLCVKWDADDFDPDKCICVCLKCRAARCGMVQCSDEAEHRECSKHAEPRDEYDPDEPRFVRRG